MRLLAVLAQIVAFGLFSLNSFADPSPLTLEMALTEGGKQSHELERTRAILGERHWKKYEALGGGFFPKISISGVHYLQTKYTNTNINFGAAPLTFPGFYPNTHASLDVMIPLFDGFANINHYRAASFMETAGEQELSRAELQLTSDIRLAFYQALAAMELKQVAQENVKTLEDHLRQIKIQRKGGVATNYDGLRVEVQLNEANADAIDAEDALVLARKKLTLLMGLENDERVLQGTLPVPDMTKVKALELKTVPLERADIQALNARADATQAMNSASNAWAFPSIAVGGQYLFYDMQSVNNSIVTNSGKFENAYNVGVFLKWNIFDGGVALAKSQEEGYLTTQAEKTSQIAKLQVPYDFAYWKRRYLSNTDHYLSKKFDITRSEESVRIAKAEERAGSRTSSERLDAELDLFRARAGVVKAQVNAAEAQIKLELTLGRKL